MDQLTKIEGQIYKITRKDDSTGYHSVIVKTTETLPKEVCSSIFSDRFFLSGKFLSVPLGKTVNFYGTWVKKKNWNFVMHHYEEKEMYNEKSIIDYLVSGLFEGVGRVKAEGIVAAFGNNALNVIKEEPLKLTQIKGIGKDTAIKIHEAVLKKDELEKLMFNLQPYKIPLTIILKAYARYKEKAMEEITKNPYCLCDLGLEFFFADIIALNCKIRNNDPNRIRTALKNILKGALANGHCYVPYSDLATRAKKLLEESKIEGEIDVSEIIKICCDMAIDEEFVIENEDGATYDPYYYKLEVEAAEKFKELTRRPAHRFQNIKTSIKNLEQKLNIKYANNQKKAFYNLNSGSVLVITGGPGTGKTTIIKGIIDIYQENYPKSNVLLCAPTGRAAKKMEEATGMPAKTIHRLLESQPYEKEVKFNKNEDNPLEGDIIIIDESSMIDLPLFLSFIKAIPKKALVIFVGDVDQLPSVGPGNILGDIIESQVTPVIFLDEIFRQKDTSKIIINADKVKHGDVDLEYNDDEFVFIEENDINNIAELIKRIFMKELESNHDITNIQVLSPMRIKSDLSTRILNKNIQEEINPRTKDKKEVYYGHSIFRKNDKVMQFRNNYDKNVFNGDLGFVNLLFPDSQTITVNIDNEDIEYCGNELSELELAYAITIHKSQGCEYDTVIIPLSLQHSRMLLRNLIYTGLTRAKKKVIFVGEVAALNLAINNTKVLKRYTKLWKRLKEVGG